MSTSLLSFFCMDIFDKPDQQKQKWHTCSCPMGKHMETDIMKIVSWHILCPMCKCACWLFCVLKCAEVIIWIEKSYIITLRWVCVLLWCISIPANWSGLLFAQLLRICWQFPLQQIVFGQQYIPPMSFAMVEAKVSFIFYWNHKWHSR